MFGTRAALAGRLVLPVSRNFLITFCASASRRRREMYCDHARLCVCVRGRRPTLLNGPGCNGGVVGDAPSYILRES